MQDHNASSIRSYTESIWVCQRFDAEAQLPRELSDIICENARGNFLWARLVTDELRQGILRGDTISALRKQVQTMPVEVQNMYGRIFDKLPPTLQIEASIYLYLIRVPGLSTVRDLYVGYDEYISSCGLEDTAFPISVDHNTDSRILATIGDFVTIERRDLLCASPGCHSYVKYAHETIGAFFNMEWFLTHLPPDRPAQDQTRSRKHSKAKVIEREVFGDDLALMCPPTPGPRKVSSTGESSLSTKDYNELLQKYGFKPGSTINS